ncbi:hypothetical protein [Nannocystis pusilla]|uniref:Uncharacterized protein n=1 Tax=Nannocystis pusilla TaxID=889268 RepID=A0ABS7U0R0_9BACT|nr:hypothetical protein [Nannocystis pusilla]MBZ5713927.1 hypothetical protein [Nannocystis pusilla]
MIRGSCQEEFGAARVPLRVELPPEVEPLRDYLVYGTRIDGHTWDARSSLCEEIDPGRSWAGEAGTDLVFAVCDRSELRERYPLPGPHRVEMLVGTVDQSQLITTPALVVEFTCAPPGAPLPQPVEEPPASVEPPKPPEPPELRSRGCTLGEPGFAWVLGAVGWARRRRRGGEPAR